MIKKRLLAFLGDSKKYIWGNVLCQWLMLLCSVCMTCMVGNLLQSLLLGTSFSLLLPALIIIVAIVLRYALTRLASHMSFSASSSVKLKLRDAVYEKLLRLGTAYREQVSTAEVVQVATEGVEQLELYYGSFLPQFFYSMLAPLSLFVFIAGIHLPTALVLLVMVPLIPVTIVAVQKIAKRLLAQYWGQYAKLGDSFLENLQGLTTLKIYQADEQKAEDMAQESEHFRKVTMKVLTMQLNSITVMDLIAYGGAAIGLILSLRAFAAGSISFWGCFVIIMLSAEFFLPMRALGSYFHTAMNGMAASDKIFRILDLEEPEERSATPTNDITIAMDKLSFSYDESRTVLEDITMLFPVGSFCAIVGESGSGKSTIGGILMGRNRRYGGTASIGGVPLTEIAEAELMNTITYISHNSYLFQGTVEENMRMAKQNALEGELWHALEQVKLADFLRSEDGLATRLEENAANFSGGQRQRLALARALLHDSPVYLFDEATSNIDVESENDILSVIAGLAKTKTVIFISHRLSSSADADCIYVLEAGHLVGAGKHDTLLQNCTQYNALWQQQQALEQYGRGL